MLEGFDKVLDSMFGEAGSAAAALQESTHDEEAITSLVKDFLETHDKLRWPFERLWFKAILYYIGNQWITWDSKQRTWRDKSIRKWVPKPVTNRFASTIEAITAAIQSTPVMPTAWPASESVDDIATANVADKLIPIIDEEIDVGNVRLALPTWMALNADAFAYPYYDKQDETLGQSAIGHVACPECSHQGEPMEFEQACPGCGSQAPPVSAMDEMGQPIETKYPVGRLRVKVLSPIQIYLNLDLANLDDQIEFAFVEIASKGTVKSRWGKDVSADGGSITRTAQFYLRALSYISEDLSGGLAGSGFKDSVSIITYVTEPNQDYPQGLLVEMSGDGTVLNVEDNPFFVDGPAGRVYYNPLCQFAYRKVPGRLFSKAPAYDLMPKQDQLNRLESLIELAVMKGAYGVWLLPTGSSISHLSGEPGIQVRYTPTGTGGVKPDYVTGNPFSDILLKWKEMIEKDFEELGGTFDALKGNVPRGVSAGYAIQLLTERSYGRFGPVFAGWEAGWVRLYKRLLNLAKTYWTEDRTRQLKGSAGVWETERFKGADLRGNVDVKVEGGSSRPRSKLAEQAVIESLAKLGVISTQDPGQRYRVAEMFGMTNVLGAQADDFRAAGKEWADFLVWDGEARDEMGEQQGPAVRLAVDNHMAHIEDHKKRAMSDEFFQQPAQKRLVWEQHIMDHMQAMQPAPAPGASGGLAKPAGSKANEQGDQTMNTLRSGGSGALGSPAGGA